MGGLAVNLSPIHDKLQTTLLSPHGVLQLAKKGHFIEISDHDIKDKSKANLLAKFLVLLQITWTMFQCLSRKAAGLPVSVLEVHTLVHAGCALIMYCLWFRKPMDVEEPTLVSIAEFESEIALMLIRNQGSGVQPLGNLVIPGEFQKACYVGSSYRDWPGRQASEASYLVFDALERKGAESLSSPATSSEIPTRDTANGRQTLSKDHLKETKHSAATMNHTEMPEGIVAAPQVVPYGQTNPAIRFSTEHEVANLGVTGYRGNRVIKFVGPEVYERRKAAHIYKSSRLADPMRELPSIPSGCDAWAGFHSRPPFGVETQLSVCTGETAPCGIGPNAFMVGPWTGRTSDGWNMTPMVVLEVPKSLRDRLPLHNVSRSSVRSYCPLKISLSHKDLRRWQLASIALREECIPSINEADAEHRYVAMTIPGRLANYNYFVTHTFGFWGVVLELASAVQWGKEKRHILFFQGIYKHLAQNAAGGAWLPALMTLIATALLYAALHLALWDYQFPTGAEQLLWRISASTLLAVPTMIVFGLGASATYRGAGTAILLPQSRRDKHTATNSTVQGSSGELPNLEPDVSQASPTTATVEDADNDNPRDYVYPTYLVSNFIEVTALILFLIAVFYLLCRLFITVESFLSLRHVPIGVYAGVGWSKYIPHL
ncbi:MAG: hypothetical protein Q9208_006323 [Pyrenodesmia sp. 3 TL-2023]